jgi:uncharacterized membrane protein YphA (DoxX/SURF4 family)
MGHNARNPMETLPTKIIRILLGLLLLFAGINKFVPMAPPPPHNEAATAFMMALVHTGYMLPIIAIIEIFAGVCFVTGRFVALAAVLLAPIAVNIVLFHAMLDPSGGAPGFFVGAATVYLLAVHFPKYQDMLMPR